jgi:ligand-binding sensor domain-containing protein
LRREQALCLALSPTGQIWLGGPNGLSVVETDGVSRQVLDQSIVAVAFDASNVPWVCTAEGDLMRLTGPDWERMGNAWEMAGSVPRDIVVGNDGKVWLTSGEFALLAVEDGLPNVDVRALAHGPDGAVWIATAHGLARRLPSGKWTRFTTASTEGGLRSVDIWDLIVDDEGTLWIATSSGISVRTRDADWSYFDLADARSVYPEPGGTVWVGSLGGLYRIQQEALTLVP